MASSNSSSPGSTRMMTTTSTVTTTASGSSGTTVGGTGGGNDGGGVSPGSSSLYLFTFLGTLLLLLAVSCAIVARSFVLRRRFRRRMEEAIAAGLVIPQPGDKRRGLGEKPKMFEAWLAPGDHGSLEDLMPVALRSLPPPKVPRRARSTPGLNNLEGEEETPTGFFGRLQSHMSFGGPLHRSRRTAAPQSASPSVLAAEDDVASEYRMQVAVMIAMPTPGRSHYPLEQTTSPPTSKGKERGLSDDADWEDELPDVIMGVAELPLGANSTSGEPVAKTPTTS